MIFKFKRGALQSTAVILSVIVFSYGFTVYDATLYSDKPDLSEHGIKPITVIYAQEVWAQDDNKAIPPPYMNAKLRLERINLPPGTLIVLDFEQWPLQGLRFKPWKYATSIANYSETLDLFKSIRPDLRFGFFGVMPVNNFQRAIAHPESRPFRIWQEDVQRLAPLAVKVDAAFPVAYTYTDDPVKWSAYFSAAMHELASIYSGKIYPFIWPQYFDHAPTPEHLRLKYVDPTLWRGQLEAIYEQADGVVVWGGWDFANKRKLSWDDNADWWLELKDFIMDRNLSLSE